MKKTKTLLSLSLILLLFISNNSSANPLSFSEKEVTIDFESNLEEVLKNRKELSFLLIADFTNEELKAWEKQVKSDENVKQIKLSKASNNKGWDVILILKNEINRSNAKMLFSFSLKADYIIVGNEKILFNVFVSKHIPN
ncbi:MAG: hypothetical protein OQJ96_06455 [Flavobacteriales bacterium]|nr:hypothetical protein [Flavobacteriales bacterium]MCW8914130.1 hypothetical protein [Flavobacteriales bacterium]MCW8938447.1 hypothetical protein [Flavobacteriales bacterium]MCW8939269.1 hypothetical protein [Flavobacteriales bacterium]MCW8969238.1 hypothetical protein [Flavobacteriales bacterium]